MDQMADKHEPPPRRTSAIIWCCLICGHATAQSPPSPALEQSYYIDLDVASGTFSQWRYNDIGPLNNLHGILRVPRLRKDPKWRPTFTIFLKSDTKQPSSNELGLQISASDAKSPLKMQLVGSVAGNPIQSIPLATTVAVSEDLKVKMSWSLPPQVIEITVGDSETRTVQVAWAVHSIAVTGSTGQMKIDPLVLAASGP